MFGSNKYNPYRLIIGIACAIAVARTVWIAKKHTQRVLYTPYKLNGLSEASSISVLKTANFAFHRCMIPQSAELNGTFLTL